MSSEHDLPKWLELVYDKAVESELKMELEDKSDEGGFALIEQRFGNALELAKKDAVEPEEFAEKVNLWEKEIRCDISAFEDALVSCDADSACRISRQVRTAYVRQLFFVPNLTDRGLLKECGELLFRGAESLEQAGANSGFVRNIRHRAHVLESFHEALVSGGTDAGEFARKYREVSKETASRAKKEYIGKVLRLMPSES